MTYNSITLRRRAILLICSLALGMLIFSLRPGVIVTHAQSAVTGKWTISPMSNGVLIIGPLGSVSFCPGTTYTQANSESSAWATGECTELANRMVVPTADSWTITPVAGQTIAPSPTPGIFTVSTATAFLQDNTSGQAVQCTTAVTVNGQSVYVNGNCRNMGTLPQ